jgi:hypothetical protein
MNIIYLFNYFCYIQVHYNIGKLHADQGNIEYAIEKYREAIE